MSKSHCIDCMRFDPPKDCSGEMGYCTQCGEKTNSYCPKCFWFVPKRGVKNGDEKEKKTNPRKKVITEAEARIIINRAMDKAIHDLSIIALCVAAMSAHDVYDHGPKRLERLIIDMLRKFRDWDDGLFTVEDARQWLEDYTGIKIEDMEVPRG